MKIIIIFLLVLNLSININSNLVFAEIEKTNLILHTFRNHSFNEGQPIVFVGKLITESGNPVPDAKIIIKGDATCSDGDIATGFTDKKGRFWIYTITRVWDPSDNMISVFAEFEGNEMLEKSKSQEQIVVVYKIKAQSC